MTELEIERLGGRGDGVARGADGAAIHVPGALPGERVGVDILDGAATLRAVIEPSAARVTPPCRHAAGCGGCALQHADLGWLAAWKRERVLGALNRAGVETEVAPTIASPPASRRRVVFTAVRRKSGVALGFHRARHVRIEPIESCALARPEIIAALPALRALAGMAASRSAEIRIAVTSSEDGLDVAVDGAKPLDLRLSEALAEWCARHDPARLSWNGEVAIRRRAARQRFGRALVEPSPGGFLQATRQGEAAMVGIACEALAGAARIADLFAGAGTFSLPLAERAEVLAVESDAGLVEALTLAANATTGLKRVAVVRRDLFRRPLLASELSGIDAALFDPPRAGAEAQARELARELARASIETVVGVSCDPASFARDARILSDGGWRLARVTPVDQFLWSPHVELIGVFRR